MMYSLKRCWIREVSDYRGARLESCRIIERGSAVLYAVYLFQ